MLCLDFYIKQSQGERWTPEFPSCKQPNQSYATDVILAHTNSIVPNDMAQRTAPTSDHPQHLCGQGHFRLWDLYAPLTLSQQAVHPHSSTSHMLSILCYENISFERRNIHIITLNTLN